MARGGKRVGSPGTPYPNRSDLRAPAAPTGLPYGERGQLIAAQRAVPAGPAPTPGGAPQGGPPVAAPGSLPWMHPTNRPTEPVQAGLASGPGPGPEALGLLQPRQQPNDPLTQAVAALNALGPKADAETSRLRDAMNATLGNRVAP